MHRVAPAVIRLEFQANADDEVEHAFALDFALVAGGALDNAVVSVRRPCSTGSPSAPPLRLLCRFGSLVARAVSKRFGRLTVCVTEPLSKDTPA